MLEEAYEAVEAIDNKDSENLKEELGDVLLQTVFHSQLAGEKNDFDILDVINEECEKMIRRHPHVFSGAEAKCNVIRHMLHDAALITGVMIGFRLAASTVFLNILGLKNTVLFALSHSMPLTLLIAVATIAYKSGGINENFYFSFILASLTQAIIVTISIKILMSVKSNLQRS